MNDQSSQNTAESSSNSIQLAGLNVAVTGSKGLVGRELVGSLRTEKSRVTRIVRRRPGENDVVWDPTAPSFDAAALDGTDAVVHLAGENIAGKRWDEEVKQAIFDSRVHGTRILCEGLAKMESPPQTLVCASAIGYYGDRGDEELTENSSCGEGFLPDVAREWEEATAPALDAGIRVVNLRYGVILSPRGGGLKEMLFPFKMGVGGVMGSGEQYWSWISIVDAVGVILYALKDKTMAGPVNAVAPTPVTNHEFTKALGRVLRRPTIFPMPAFMARMVLGEMADALLLSSLRVVPEKLLASGYTYQHAELEAALRRLLGKSVH